MATLGTIVVKMVGDTGGFTQSMQTAERVASTSSSSIGTNVKSGMDTASHAVAVSSASIGVSMKAGMDAASVAIGTFTGGAIPKLLDGFKRTLNAAGDWADKLDSLGDTLGTTANESAAITVALKPFGDAGEQITEQISKLAKGLTDAKGELGPTGKELQKLGIQFTDAKGKMVPAYTLLQSISTKVSQMPDGLEKTSVMMDLFGKSGKGMSDAMSAMANGGLDDAMHKAEAFGLAIGDTGVQSAIDMNKGMTDLQLAAQGLAVSVGSNLLPVILLLVQTLANLAVEYMPKVRAAFDQVGVSVQPFVYFVTNLLQQIGSGGDPFAAVTNGLITLLMQLGMAPGQAAGLVNGIMSEIARIGGAFTALANGDTGPIIDLVKRYAKIFLDWVQNDVIPFIGPKIAELATNIGTWVSTNAPIIAEKVREWATVFLAWVQNSVLPFLGAKITEVATTIGTWVTTNAPTIETKVKEWATAFLSWINVDVVPFLSDKLNAIWFEISNWVSLQSVLLKIKLSEWAQRFTDWIQMDVLPDLPRNLYNITYAISGWIFQQGKDFRKNLPEWTKSFTDWISNDAVPALVKALPTINEVIMTWFYKLPLAVAGAIAIMASALVNQMIDSIGGELPRLRQFLYHVIKDAIVAVAGVMGIKVNLPDDLPTGQLPPHRASGGPVDAGQAYFVGENGPEVVVPKTSGTVVPNGALGDTHVHVHLDGSEIAHYTVGRLSGELLNARMSTYGAQ